MKKNLFHVSKNSRSVSILLAFVLILSSFGVMFGGSDNYVKAANSIVIMDAAGLDAIRQDLTGNYILGADIDLNVAPYNVGDGWEPIGGSGNSFGGSFDGNGYTISNLMIERPDDEYVGLFGIVGNQAKIKDVSLVDVNVRGERYVGGLVGSSSVDSSIVSSAVTGNVDGNNDIGGLVGYHAGVIETSSAAGQVNGVSYAGGLVGYVTSDGKIFDSGSSSEVNGTLNYVGGLVGYHAGVIEMSSAAGQVNGTSNVGGLVGDVRPAGKIINSKSSSEVNGISNYVGGLVGYHAGAIEASSAAGQVNGVSYAGGLVGYVTSGGKISDSESSGDVEGTGDYTGGLVGYHAGVIETSLAAGQVNGTSYVGGLVGRVTETGTISGSESSGDVNGTGTNVGGLVGYHAGVIETSLAIGIVNGEGSTGGLVGATAGSILKSYASGNVSGKTTGGLVGRQYEDGEIIDTYASGAVNGEEEAGGLVGRDQGGMIENSYAIGSVTGDPSQVGGLAGVVNLNSQIMDSFYNSETTGQTDDDGKGTPKTTAEMQDQATFTNWDFASTWELPAGDYPHLQWEIDPSNEIESVESLADITVNFGTALVGVDLPDQVAVTLDDNSTVNLDVTWDGGTPAYDGNIAGTYDFAGQLTLGANMINPNNFAATVKVTVKAKQVIPANPGGTIWVGSDDASLKQLELFDVNGDPIQLTPSFAKDVLQYEVETAAEQVELVVKATYIAAQVMLQDEKIDDRKVLNLVTGENEFLLTVKAEDGSTKNYKLIIQRTEEKPVEPTPPFVHLTDIDGHWAETLIKRAVANGIVNGHPDHQFKPDQPTTRAEFTVMLANALKLNNTEINESFVDDQLIGDWAKRAVAGTVQEGIIFGYEDNTFRPNQFITRSEMMVMIARALELTNHAEVTSFADDADIPAWAKGAVEASRVKGIVKGRENNRFYPLEQATRAESLAVIVRMIELK